MATFQDLITRQWCRVLHRETVEAHENFFDLGGNSLTAIELASAVNQTLGVGIDARLVFSCPTLAAFRQSVARLHDSRDSETDSAAVERENWPLLPSHAWFFSKQLPRPELFCEGLIFSVAEGVRLDALHRAVTVAADHHDALRTQFRQTGRAWEQVPVRDAVRVDHHDLTGFGLDDQLEHIRQIGAAMAGGFTFGVGPLVGFATIDLGPDRGLRFLLVAHHLLGDHGSWRILLEDIEAAYHWTVAGAHGAPPLVATTGVREWAVWLNGRDVAMEAVRQAEYWQRPRPPISLPSNPGGPGRPDVVKRPIGEPMATAIVSAARYHRVGADVLLLAAFTQTLAEWRDTDHISLDLISHGRTPTPRGFNLSRTVGWLTRQAPLYVDLPADRRPPSMIDAIVQALSERPGDGIGYAALRFGSTMAGQGIASLPADAPLGFNYLGNANTRYRSLTLFASSPDDTGLRRSHPPLRPLELFSALRQQEIMTAWSFDADAISRRDIERLAARLEHYATALAADSSCAGA